MELEACGKEPPLLDEIGVMVAFYWRWWNWLALHERGEGRHCVVETFASASYPLLLAVIVHMWSCNPLKSGGLNAAEWVVDNGNTVSNRVLPHSRLQGRVENSRSKKEGKRA